MQLKQRRATADEDHVRGARRLITAFVSLAAFGVLSVSTASHRPTPKSPSPKTRAMIWTVTSVGYCIQEYSNGHWLNMNSSGKVTDGSCR